MRCAKCGKKLKSNEIFCTVCGYYNSELDKEEIDEDFPLDDEESEELEITDTKHKKKSDDFLDIDLKDKKITKKIKSEVVDENEKLEKFIKLSENEELDDSKYSPNISFDMNASGEKEDEFYYENEELLEYYIGEDYKLIKKSPFNIYACILNWMYVLYRKMYLFGIIGLIITGFILVEFPKYFIIYAVVTMLLLGFIFNKLYIFSSKNKVNRIVNKSSEDDRFNLKKICAKKGGVNILRALIIYGLFLVIVIAYMFRIRIVEPTYTKFYKENSENKANCISMIKTAYKNAIDKNKELTIKEATCQKQEDGEFKFFLDDLKNNNDYYYYYDTSKGFLRYRNDTFDIDLLEEKKANNTITNYEIEILNEKNQIEEIYKSISKKSKEEDKLIEEEKNEEEKKNYIITKEEITR